MKWFLVGLAVLAWSAQAKADNLTQAVAFAITGMDSEPVEVIDRKNCVFRLGARTYFMNNIITDSVTFQPFTRQIGNYTRVTIIGKSKVMEEVYQGVAQPTTKVELMVQSPDNARVMRAWSFIYANGCKGQRSPF